MKNYSQETLNYISYLNGTTFKMNEYFNIVIASIGIPGNLIGIVVFSRLIGRKTNMGLLYTCQCVIDFITMIIILLIIRGSTLFYGSNIMDKYDSICKFTFFMRRFMLNNSSWMAVITSFDRFVFIFYKNRFQFMRSKIKLFAIIITIMFFMALINIPNMFYAISPQQICSANFSITLLSDIISILFRTYIPLTLMVIFYVMMIYKISKTRANNALAKLPRGHRPRKENQFTIAVISSDVMFFITHFPLSISYLVYDAYLYSGIFSHDPLLAAENVFSLFLIINISFLDMTFSVFIYFTFNKVFRKEFLNLIFLRYWSRTHLTRMTTLDSNLQHSTHK